MTQIAVGEIPIVIQTGENGCLHLEGHTEIVVAFREFTKDYPEAKRYELQLNPAPYNELYAQPFKHIRNEFVVDLFARWLEQLVGLERAHLLPQ